MRSWSCCHSSMKGRSALILASATWYRVMLRDKVRSPVGVGVGATVGLELGLGLGLGFGLGLG